MTTNLASIVDAKNIFILQNNDISKKQILENIAQTIADNADINFKTILSALLNREKMGSTVIGHGVALPHGRVEGLSAPQLVIIRLEKPIFFDPNNEEAVDIIIGLCVPIDATDAHLQILSSIAKKLSDVNIRNELRKAKSAEAIYKLFL